jgi:hypothetical protein
MKVREGGHGTLPRVAQWLTWKRYTFGSSSTETEGENTLTWDRLC